jgi:hypothetical protein
MANGVITLNSSSIENSSGHGIDALSGTVFLNGGTVRNNSRGLQVGSASFVLVDAGTVISESTADGAVVSSSGSLTLRSGTIENNSPDDLNVNNGGIATLLGGFAVVKSNERDGVAVFGGSVRSVGVISNNGRHGISVFNNGTVILDTGAIVASNAANGVLVEDGTVNVGNGDGRATIQSNSANGIYLKTNSVGFFNNAGNQIVSNGGWGILCDKPPANPLIAIGPAGTIGTVSGNGAGQISCNMAP